MPILSVTKDTITQFGMSKYVNLWIAVYDVDLIIKILVLPMHYTICWCLLYLYFYDSSAQLAITLLVLHMTGLLEFGQLINPAFANNGWASFWCWCKWTCWSYTLWIELWINWIIGVCNSFMFGYLLVFINALYWCQHDLADLFSFCLKMFCITVCPVARKL